MATTSAAFVKKVDSFTATIEAKSVEGVNAAARLLAREGNRQLVQTTGGDRRLSGLGNGAWRDKGGVGLEVVAKPATSKRKPTAIVVGNPAGPFALHSFRIAKHLIGGGRTRAGIDAFLASDLKTRNKLVVRVRQSDGRVTRIKKRRIYGSVKRQFGPVWGPFEGGGSPQHPVLQRALTAKERQATSLAMDPITAQWRETWGSA